MYDLIDRQAVLDFLTDEWDGNILHLFNCIKHIPSAPMKMRMDSYGITVTPAIVHDRAERKTDDLISRQAAIDAARDWYEWLICGSFKGLEKRLRALPSAQPERVWHPVEKPPAHHKDVIVRGVEAIGNVTVHKVMQWDVDTWRPTDYAPSIMWTEWSEI